MLLAENLHFPKLDRYRGTCKAWYISITKCLIRQEPTIQKMSHCEYCDNLKPAIDRVNYCSHRNQNLLDVASNAYYFSHNRFRSDDHLSRFSIRTVYNGYQTYEVENRVHEIRQDRFLVVNEGDRFTHSVEQEQKAESLIIAFNPNFLKHYLYSINHSEEQLLDRPFEKTEASFYFYQSSYEMSVTLNEYLKKLIKDIKEGDKDPLYFQTVFYQVLSELVGIERDLQNRISSLSATRKSTRDELYRRISKGKDFIDAHLKEKLSIERIAKECCLSPFHFLRTFSKFYEVTPYQYILAERLRKAQYLIDCTSTDLTQIIEATGFEHKRTFQRAFQKKYGMTPFARIQENRV